MQYVLKTNPAVRQKGMVLGYDGRYNSDKYVAMTGDTIVINM